MWGAGRDEDGVSHGLRDGPASHSVFLQQPLTEVRVEVDQLVVNGVRSHGLMQPPLLKHLGMGEWGNGRM